MSAAAPLRVAVIGARGKLGGFACALLARTPGFEFAAGYEREDDWPRALASSGAQLALEATRAGLGFEHAQRVLTLGLRVVVATSGVDAAQNAELDRLARERDLGGIVVPNFSLGAWLLQRAVEQAALHFDAIEITELHHARKADAPSGTALETARRIAAARRSAGLAPLAPASPEPDARGDVRDGVPIHSVRMPGLYAHQEVLLGRAGETLTLRHDMSGPEAFGPGLLLALRFASTAVGVARGLDAALACARASGD